MDLLIKLYDLPDFAEKIDEVEQQGIQIRRARAFEKNQILEWINNVFGNGWAGECDVAFSRQPITCFIAVAEDGIVGFACHECTCRGFFGPIGVSEKHRRKDIGAALLAISLMDMAAMGYAYAIVGDGSQVQTFYSRIVDVQPIDGSTPGIYSDPLKKNKNNRGSK